MPSVQSVWWIFTLNFEGEKPELSFSDDVQYCIYQHERVNHDHFQGVIQFKKKLSLHAVRRSFGCYNPHLEPVRGSVEEAIRYCSKESSRVSMPVEHGIFIPRGSNKRSRLIQCQTSPERMKLEDPDLFNSFKAAESFKRFKIDYVCPNLDRGWQLILKEGLCSEPDARTVHWVYGPNGAEGKSTFAKWLKTQDWFVVQPSSVKDMSHLYGSFDPESNVCVDVSRRVEPTHMDAIYEFVEMVKNRNIQVTKYRSYIYHSVKSIHVVVMSNYLPDYCKISEDRIKLIEC